MANRDTRALVAHLFRRAGFGLRPEELNQFTGLGVQGSVEYLINYDRVADPVDQQYPPDVTPLLVYHMPGQKLTPEQLKAEAQVRNQVKLALQVWWVNRMLGTTRPLQEKMTLFWHGHFATGITKARAFMLQQNQLFRSMALGNFNTLLKAVNQDPAMLLWLDGAQNRAGKPNENFSRELMELFTLGVGNYTEQDVREGARALTGWTFRPRLAMAALQAGQPVQAMLVPRLHDSGTKTYLGHIGNLGSDDVMDILSAHPHTGPFLVRKLFEFFAYDGPDAATIQPLVDTYYSSRYDLRAVVRQLLLSDAFYSDRSFQQHIKSPVEFVVGSVRELGSPIEPLAMIRAMDLMGQELFNPPNVGGWPGGITWVDASALVARFNFAGRLTLRQGMMVNNLNPQQLVQQSGARDNAGLVDYLLGRFIGVGATPATRAALVGYLGGNGTLSPLTIETKVRGLLQLVLSTPEYQLN